MDPATLPKRLASARDILRGGLISAAVALAAVLYAGWGLWRETHFVNHAVRARAEVVRVQRSKDEDTRITLYWPTFSFRDASEHQWTVPSRTSVPTILPVGEPINIVYNPEDPAGARLESDRGSWLLPSAVGIVGLVFMVAGLFTAYRSRDTLLDLRAEADRADSCEPPNPAGP